jgi:hypothetical protein
MKDFNDEDFWRSIILYGLNQSTYKIALGKTLISLADQNYTTVKWDTLSLEFLKQYQERLNIEEPMPQLADPLKRTFMERAVRKLELGTTDIDETISSVGKEGFNDVIKRFHNIGRFNDFQGKFYSFDFGKSISLTDNLHNIVEKQRNAISDELDARWALLEGAFAIKADNFELANEIIDIYLLKGTKRKNLTNIIPFLQGYQGNTCFYCGQEIDEDDYHVDHVLPRLILNHDQIWNLVLSHSTCNLSKSTKLVGKHFMEKLIFRNENIMGSNHPWKNKISFELGRTKKQRAFNLLKDYENVKIVLGDHYWGGIDSYNPMNDDFYKRLITVLNNGKYP